MRPPVEAPSAKNWMAPWSWRDCTCRAPVKRTSRGSGQVAVMAAGRFPTPLLRVDQKALRRAGGDGLGARIAQLRGDGLAGAAQTHAVDAAGERGGGQHTGQRDQRDDQQHLQQRAATQLPAHNGRSAVRGQKRQTRNAHGSLLTGT